MTDFQVKHKSASKLEIEFYSDPALLQSIRSCLTEWNKQRGLDKKTNDEVVLAIDEACTNIIRHCYQMENSEKIVLCCDWDDDGITYTLRDFGPPQDCCKIMHRDIDQVKPGGLGVYFIKEIMDEVRYESKKDGNMLTMKKKCKLS